MAVERSCKPNEGRGGVSVFTTLGTLILTARPYEAGLRGSVSFHTSVAGRDSGDVHGATLQGEIFQTVNKEVCTFNRHMTQLHHIQSHSCITYTLTVAQCSLNDVIRER